MDALGHRKLNRWVLMQRKPETSLEGKTTNLKLYYFKHIMRRQGSLEKAVMLGNMEGSRKRGRSNMRWIDCVKETTDLSLQELSRATEGGTQLIRRVARSQTQYHITHTCISICDILRSYRYATRIN